MKIFIDTSALVKRYIFESGSDKIDFLFEECSEILISCITAIEMNSALKRRYWEKDLTEDEYISILTEFNEDIKDFIFNDLLTEVKINSIELIKKYKIKTLDSIQLGTACLSNADVFVTSDKKLYDLAIKEFKNKSILI